MKLIINRQDIEYGKMHLDINESKFKHIEDNYYLANGFYYDSKQDKIRYNAFKQVYYKYKDYMMLVCSLDRFNSSKDKVIEFFKDFDFGYEISTQAIEDHKKELIAKKERTVERNEQREQDRIERDKESERIYNKELQSVEDAILNGETIGNGVYLINYLESKGYRIPPKTKGSLKGFTSLGISTRPDNNYLYISQYRNDKRSRIDFTNINRYLTEIRCNLTILK